MQRENRETRTQDSTQTSCFFDTFIRTLRFAVLILIVTVLFIGCAGFPKGPDRSAAEAESKTGEKARKEEPPVEVDPYQAMSASMAAGDPQKALDDFEQAYSKDPDSPETQLLYSSLLISVGKAAEAEAALEKLLAKVEAQKQPDPQSSTQASPAENPADSQTADQAPNQAPTRIDALYNLALAKGMQGKRAEQEELLKEVLEKNPDHAPAHATLGEIYLENKELDRAQLQFQKSIEADPDNFIARTGYGHVLIRKKKYEEAVEQLDKAVELKPDYPFSYVDRSKAKSRSGDINGALADLTEAIKLDGNHYWNYIDRGKLRLYVGNLEGAYEDFDQAVKLRPDFFLGYVYRGGANDDLDHIEAALSDYRSVSELRPDYYPVYQPYALIAYEQEQYREAARAFQQHYDRYSKDHGHAIMAAVSYYFAGDKDKGDAYLKKHLNNLPKDTYMYDVARTFIENGYDSYLLTKINSESNVTIKTRALFYAAVYYELQGNLGLARKYYLEVDEANIYGLIETRLAESKIKAAFDES
jgi:tetratricopeptide (TPR) repeat protein